MKIRRWGEKEEGNVKRGRLIVFLTHQRERDSIAMLDFNFFFF